MRISVLLFILFFSCSKHSDNSDSPAVSPAPDSPAAPSVDDGLLDASGPYAIIRKGKKSYHTGLLKSDPNSKRFGQLHVTLAGCEGLPEEFDLRKLGFVPDIRDQGGCGSCWSFSKTGSLESALLAAGKPKLDLSEQELVSCDKSQWGCEGGLLTDFKYQIEHGQSLEADLGYTSGNTGRNGNCKDGLKPAAKGINFSYVGSSSRAPTEEELKCALYKNHTVPWITVSASGGWGSPPKSERTAYSRCGHGQTNHAVGVVGWWKDSKGKNQFIMKNSWGLEWGDQGYMSLPLGCDSFGDEVAFIQVEASNPPSPPPCTVPKAKLPAEVQVFSDTEIMLGVKAEAGVSYVWSIEGAQVGMESMLYVVPMKDQIYKLSAKNACASTESQVRVRIVHSNP